MDILNQLINGIVQGFSELAAVSASGHRMFLPEGWNSAGLENWIYAGLILVILLVYRRTVWGLLAGIGTMVKGLFAGTFKWRKASHYQVMAVCFLLACLPLGVAVLVRIYAMDYVARFAGNGLFTGLMMLLNGGLLFLGEHSLDQKKELRDMKPIEGIKLGLFGAFSLLPGLSSLATLLAMGLNMGFKRKDALEFAVIMAVPCFLAGRTNGSLWFQGAEPVLWSVAVGAAMLAGLAGLFLLKWLLKKERLHWLAYYSGIAGIAVILLNFIG